MLFPGKWFLQPGKALLVLGLIMLMPLSAFAQVAEGKIEGVVRDKETGSPLPGAQVVVEGTNLGNITNQDGYYFILNVPPGLRTITATYTGYQKTSVGDQRIAAGHTATINFELSSTVVNLEGIVIEGEAEPLMQRDNVQTRQTVTLEETADIPTSQLNSIIAMQAGIRTQGDFGFTIRGGRQNEEAIYIDGVLVRNFSTGLNEQSPADDATNVHVATDAIEEVSVITGGFQAEYGNAQSGVVNIVTRSGGQEFSGSIALKTDELLPAEYSYGYNQLRANVGGPFLAPNSNFFGALELNGTKDQSPHRGDEYGRFTSINQRFYDGLNKTLGGYMSDNGITLSDLPTFNLPNWGERVGQEADEYLLSGKVNIPVGDNFTTMLSYTQNRNQNMSFSIQNNLLNMAGREASYNRTKNLVLGIDWDLTKSATSSYALRGRFSGYENDRHFGPIDPSWAGNPTGVVDFRDGNINDGRGTLLNFGFGDYDFLYGDIYDKIDAVTVEEEYGIDRWDQHLPTSSATGNMIWGWGSLVDGGTSIDVLNQKEQSATIKLDLDAQLDRYNRVKMGIDWKIISLNALNLTNFGGLTSGDTQNYYRSHPSLFSAYFQDRVDVGDLVVDFGLRWDRMDPRSMFPEEAGAGPASPHVEAPVRNVLSPRIGIAHPVTDRTQFRFSYGHFYQPPPFDLMFAQKNVQSSYTWSITGDKDLDYSKTTAFEVGFTWLMTEDLVLDAVGYYRDFEGNMAVRYWIPAYDSRPFPFYSNQDNGNTKGVDITLKKRFNKYFSYNIAYSMQVARGTGSTPGFYTRPDRLVDTVTGEYIEPPVNFWPVNNDRTHNVTAQFNLRLPEDFQEGTFLGNTLKNTSYYLVQGFSSGGFTNVRTPQALSGSRVALTDPNSLRGRSGKSTSLRVTKNFNVSRGIKLSAYVEILNMIQWDVNKDYFPVSTAQLEAIENEFSTGSGVTGTQYIGSYTTSPVSAYVGNPVAVYQAALRDYNNDGAISRSEQFVAERLNQAIIDGWNAGGTPRVWRFGFEYDF